MSGPTADAHDDRPDEPTPEDPGPLSAARAARRRTDRARVRDHAVAGEAMKARVLAIDPGHR